jgi:hypothetical protein
MTDDAHPAALDTTRSSAAVFHFDEGERVHGRAHSQPENCFIELQRALEREYVATLAELERSLRRGRRSAFTAPMAARPSSTD